MCRLIKFCSTNIFKSYIFNEVSFMFKLESLQLIFSFITIIRTQMSDYDMNIEALRPNKLYSDVSNSSNLKKYRAPSERTNSK